jgi:hypothetical protein
VSQLLHCSSRLQLKTLGQLPGTPRAVSFSPELNGFLVASRLGLALVRPGGSLEFLMARHAKLPDVNSVLAISRSQILAGICGGVAQIHLPWQSRESGPVNDIPVVTYWTRGR